MKKISLSVLLLLSACVEMSNPNGLDSKSVAEVKREKNAKCLDIYKVKVFQVLNDGSALATECKKDFMSETCYGKTVALIVQRKVDFYDEMIVEPEAEKCFVQDGIYRYETKSGLNKTVPVVTFDYKYKVKTDEEFLKRFSEFTKDFRFICEKNLKQGKAKQDSKKCECIENNMEKMLEFKGKENMSEETFLKEFQNFIEKKCGKIDF